MSDTAAGIHPALLVPVPEEHLESGLDICRKQGKVAFGSRMFEVFQELDAMLDGKPCPVLIYASWPKTPLPVATVTWSGTYVGHVHSRGGQHPDKMKYRPPTTAQYPDDNIGHWAVFYHVSELTKLPKEQRIEIPLLYPFGKPKAYPKTTKIEHPVIVKSPY